MVRTRIRQDPDRGDPPRSPAPPPEEKGEPANFLIIGTDSRAFVQNERQVEAFGSAAEVVGQRSDTMMVVHVEPAAKRGFVVSFPRDPWVAIPGHGENRLNTALELGGPSLLIETITANFDVPITHYLEIDIDGFQKIVDTLGGVDIYFPAPARDSFSGLTNLKPAAGSSTAARRSLTSRARHYEWYDGAAQRWRTDPRSDLSRIERQQYFMRSLARGCARSRREQSRHRARARLRHVAVRAEGPEPRAVRHQGPDQFVPRSRAVRDRDVDAAGRGCEAR